MHTLCYHDFDLVYLATLTCADDGAWYIRASTRNFDAGVWEQCSSPDKWVYFWIYVKY